MSESENKLSEGKSSMDVTLALQQYLRSLRLAGMTTLPRGEGLFQFSLMPATVAPVTEGSAEKVDLQVVNESGDSNGISAVDLSGSTIERVSETPAAAQYLLDENKYGPSLGLQERQRALDVIQTEVRACQQCSELANSRTQTVFGVGNIAPRLVFVGEGPGADEDRTGEPFVGAAGQLLNKILAASKLDREEVYILNTVKCRPPGNRNPSQTELDNCWGYAERQLEVLRPEFICCLGSVAAKRVLNTTQSLGRLRQRFHQYRGSRVVVTYHPAYLLRNESAKKHVWEDMKLLMKELGIDLSK
jgi:uracil-DNA glycosylase family 4